LNNVLISGGLSFDTLEPFNCTSSKHFWIVSMFWNFSWDPCVPSCLISICK
jgi:hypothetical protein